MRVLFLLTIISFLIDCKQVKESKAIFISFFKPKQEMFYHKVTFQRNTGQMKIKGLFPVSPEDRLTSPVYRLLWNAENQLTNVTYKYRGELIESSFAGVNVAEVRLSYEEETYVLREYLNSLGEPVLNYRGAHKEKIKMNKYQDPVSLVNYGKNGQMASDRYGVVQYLWELDDEGRRVKSFFTDKLGNKISDKDGIYYKTAEYFKPRTIVYRYFDEKNKPITNHLGVFAIRREYTPDEDLLLVEYLGKDDQLVYVSKFDAAKIIAEYAENGKRVKTVRYGIDGEILSVEE